MVVGVPMSPRLLDAQHALRSAGIDLTPKGYGSCDLPKSLHFALRQNGGMILHAVTARSVLGAKGLSLAQFSQVAALAAGYNGELHYLSLMSILRVEKERKYIE